MRKGENCLINIADVKKNFSKRYPDHPLTKVMLGTKDVLSEEEFLGVVSVWLEILDLEEDLKLKSEVKLK